MVSGKSSGVGGIVGWARIAKISSCKNNKELNCNANRVGGIVGAGPILINTNERLVLENCENNKSITGRIGVGGIAGMTSYTTITKCTNKNNVIATSHDEGNNSKVGGIAGYIGTTQDGTNSSVSYSYNIGTITANYRHVGGIVGSVYTTGNSEVGCSYCYNIGNVYNNDNTNYYNGKTGGIVGYKEGTLNISNCYELSGCIKAGIDNENLNPNGHKSESEIKAITWNNFKTISGINNNYPVLNWENL